MTFEHSLYAMSLWEMKYRKPFLRTNLTGEELLDYISMMSIDDNYSPEFLTSEMIESVIHYIQDQPTATMITKYGDDSGPGKIITTEVLYAYMVNAQIPFECDRWNFHRLNTLLSTISIMNNPDKKKMSVDEEARRRAELNAKRLQKG